MVRRGSCRTSRPRALAWTVVLTMIAVAAAPALSAQAPPTSDRNVAPAFEGWEQNPDGSFNLVFGYLNRNWDRAIDVPIGPDNNVEPGGPDLGQPTHFLPRRTRFLFRVHVPADFGDNEVVWTLKSDGVTERAYGTLRPDYFIDDIVIMNNNGAGGPGGGAYNISANVGPELAVEGTKTRRVKAGEAVTLTAYATDDGVPKLRPMPPPNPLGSLSGTPNSASGLRFAWFVYRGDGSVSFDPPQYNVWEDPRPGANSPWARGWAPPPIPEDNRWVVDATFDDPGTYVLRGQAHDGGLDAVEDITFIVEATAEQ